MRKSNDQIDSSNEEESIAKILRLVGRRSNMPDATKETWSRAFYSELAPVIENRRHRRRLAATVVALCASLAAVYLFFGQALQHQWDGNIALARITKVIGETKAVDTKGGVISIEEGAELYSGFTLHTSEHSLLAFQTRQTSVRLNHNTQVKIYPRKIQLLKGHLYIDTFASAEGTSPGVIISTPLATIRDIGTQFSVTYDASGMMTAVREGAVVVTVDQAEYRADAQAGHGQRISVSKDNKVEITKTAKSGELWDWHLLLAESFTIEGRTAYEFLTWAARETGLNLVFDNDQTTDNARATVLHGDVSSFPPEQAIDIVLATTRLSAQRPDTQTLYISLIRD